jgi:signal transduction histidine kinase
VPLEQMKGHTFEEIIRIAAGSGRVVLDIPLEDWVKRRMAGHRQPHHASTVQIGDGTAYLVRDRGTSAGGRAVVFTDITSQRRAEAALAEQQDALAASRAQAERQQSYLADLTRRLDQASAQADSAKTTLLRTMSHELKTPLNAILGFSDLMAAMAERLTPEQIREYSALIHQGGSALLKIINQIMDLTKIAAGRYELRRSRLDAGSLLWLAREEFGARAAARGITIDADRCPIGLAVDADETAFMTIIQNLLDNAVTFGRPGGTITLSAARREGAVAVQVADDGPGVAEADLHRILKPFEQAGASGEHDKGAGLGLTLAKAFAELQGGSLSIASRPGEGFTATVTLPPAS